MPQMARMNTNTETEFKVCLKKKGYLRVSSTCNHRPTCNAHYSQLDYLQVTHSNSSMSTSALQQRTSATPEVTCFADALPRRLGPRHVQRSRLSSKAASPTSGNTLAGSNSCQTDTTREGRMQATPTSRVTLCSSSTERSK